MFHAGFSLDSRAKSYMLKLQTRSMQFNAGPNGLVTHKTQDIPRKVPGDTSSLHYLGLPETFLGKKFVSHKTFLRTAWDLPGMIIGRSCEGNSMCDGYNTFLGSCHSVLRRPWETARKKPVMYNC